MNFLRHGFSVVAALSLTLGACTPPSRLTPCKKDEDCSAKQHCIDLKCVECRNDTDCTNGYCSFGVCKQLGGPQPSVSPESSAAPSASPAEGEPPPEPPQ